MTDKSGKFHSKKFNEKPALDYRDSLISEILLSLIMCLTILSLMIICKSYNFLGRVYIKYYTPFTILLLVVAQVFIRRSKLNNIFLIILAHAASAVAFYFAVIFIPVLEFGNSVPNRNYLILSLAFVTLYSIAYRLKPKFTARDVEIIVLPIAIHVVGYLFIVVENLDIIYGPTIVNGKEVAKRMDLQTLAARYYYLQNLIIHALIIAALFIVMRQIAVFEADNYYSLQKATGSSKYLKKQNYKTVILLVLVFVVSLGVLEFFPYASFIDLLNWVIRGIVAVLVLLRFLFRDNGPDTDLEIEEETEDEELIFEEAKDSLLVNAIAIILVVAVLLALLYVIFKAVIALVKNMPKNRKAAEELSSDDKLIDTIEDITPDRKSAGSQSHDFGSGYERRVRKRFYEKTRRAMKQGLPVSDASTPGQIETVLLAGGDKEISSLKLEYEKVRYGKQDQ